MESNTQVTQVISCLFKKTAYQILQILKCKLSNIVLSGQNMVLMTLLHMKHWAP